MIWSWSAAGTSSLVYLGTRKASTHVAPRNPDFLADIFSPGYSGVAIYTRNSKCCPIRAEEGLIGVLCPPRSTTKFRDLPADQQIGGYPREDQLIGPVDEAMLDSEGRCVILEFPAFVLIGVYVPATRDDTRTDFRMGFFSALDARIRNLVAMGKQVILAGDLNVIRTDIDTAGCADQLRKEGMTLEDFLSMPSRRFFNQLIFDGQVIGDRDEGREEPVMWDITRTFHPKREGMFTCWETKKNARPGNFGSRIDYILCTDGIKHWFEDSNIQEGLMGSDHCPVYVTFADTVKKEGVDIHITDLLNPSDMFKEGRRLREWSTKDLLPQSAKLLTEFDRRRSIRDMFAKKPAQSKPREASTIATTTESPSNASKGPDDQACTIAPSSTPAIAHATTEASSPQKPESPSKAVSKTAPTKRPSSSNTTQPNKKARSAPIKDKTKSGPSQSSLMGFFKPKTLPPSTSEQERREVDPPITADEGTEQPSPLQSPAGASSRPDNGSEAGEAGTDAIANSENGNEGASGEDGDRVFDPIESKESWSKLLGKKRAAPPCEHGEPCVSYVTKKSGLNKGTSWPSGRRIAQ